MKPMLTIDQEIKKRVQAMEIDIPAALETSISENLKDSVPEVPRLHRSRFVYYGAWAAAASIVMAILLLLFPLLHHQSLHRETEEVWVQSASVEGQPAEIFVVRQKNPEITIVWIEKISNNR